ncbi:MAG: hypothetical protein J2P16_14190, partial [Mycobacterium sp.]|nr:hypothetical protein [Mycobacterium sp.]
MKTLALSVVLTAVAVAFAPVSQAEMQVGNYTLQIARDPGHVWIWAIRGCGTPECVQVQAIPQPNGQATPYKANAQLVDGRYTMIV